MVRNFIYYAEISSILLFYALRRINEYENIIIKFQQIVLYTDERLKAVDNDGAVI